MSETGPEGPADRRPTGAGTHAFFVLCVILCGAFAAWAHYGRLDVVSMALGEVVPSSQVKSIQHLEGGIVREILVAEGARVERGQPLVVLESTQSGADVGELQINVTALRVEITRLEAEIAEQAEPVFADDLRADHADLVRQAIDLFDAHRKRQQSQIAGQREAIIQRDQDIKEISARIRNQRASLKLLDEQISISEELMKEELTNRYKHLDLLKEATRLRGRIEEDAAALKRSKSALAEAKAALDEIRTTFIEEVQQDLEEKRRRLDELTQRLQKFEDSLQRTVLRSPVEGVIKTLHTVTRGGVVRPGATVVEIVPGEDRLVIEAKLPISDIGYVQAGQTARVKLASPDAVRFGSLDGVVTLVSPDTIVTPEGSAFYKVRLETEQGYFERGGIEYRLYPGMQVMTSILTGQRTVLEYLLTPFLYGVDSALQER